MKLMTILAISTLDQIFAKIRMSAISGSSLFIKVAFTIGSLFCVIRLIKLAYDLTSDEQAGGFGGVKMWQILKPIVFIALIQASPMIVGAMDSICSTIVNGSANSIVISDADAVFENTQDALQAEYDRMTDEKLQASKDESESRIKELLRSGDINGVAYEKFTQFLESCWTKLKQKVFGWTSKLNGKLIPNLIILIYKYFGYAFLVIANVLLCLIAFLFPISIALSVLDIWKDNFVHLMVQYVQVSFWKVILVAVQWVIAEARIGASQIALNLLGKDIGSGDLIAQYECTLTLATIICLAGCFCITKIPEWSSLIIGGRPTDGSGPAMILAKAPLTGTQKGAKAISALGSAAAKMAK